LKGKIDEQVVNVHAVAILAGEDQRAEREKAAKPGQAMLRRGDETASEQRKACDAEGAHVSAGCG